MRLALTAALAASLLTLPVPGRADDEARIRAARARLDAEPKVDVVVRRALEYFRVEPGKIDSLRAASRWRGALPLLAAGYRRDDLRVARLESQLPTPLTTEEATNNVTDAYTIGGVWDLRQLVFNPAEVQVYGLIGVQRDLMLEVTRVYFLRRQLYMRMQLRPPEDPIAREALQLRIDEFTSLLDVLTGGWFSAQSTSK